jgi:hypothetical protein
MQASFVVVVVAWLVSASLVLGQYSGKVRSLRGSSTARTAV